MVSRETLLSSFVINGAMEKRKKDRTTLIIHCSVEEAEAIRSTARADRRTISAFVLMSTLQRVEGMRAVQRRAAKRGIVRRFPAAQANPVSHLQR